MTTIEHIIHGVWPVVVVTFHRYLLDKLLAPIGRYLLSLVKPSKLVEKAVDSVEEAIEHKLVDRKQQIIGGDS